MPHLGYWQQLHLFTGV